MLYIMRYGKTDWNVQHKLQGIDIPNNEKYMKNVQNTYVKLFLYATI
jgi:broad specificity phosphatase PhoE